MSPPLATDAPAHKIKGGRWTVFKFFLISTAYTSVWMAVSSQLDYFRELYGPQILLQLNIAYYLPTGAWAGREARRQGGAGRMARAHSEPVKHCQPRPAVPDQPFHRPARP